jgi:hypothetical protein
MNDVRLVSAGVARWAARILSGLILLVWGGFGAAHVLGEEGRSSRPLTWADYVILAAVAVSLVGLGVAWRWERVGAATALLAVGVCAAVTWKVLVFPGTLIPITAALFLCSWWLGRARR